MGVDLRGCQVLVAQEFLDSADIGTSIEHVGSERVTESMWRRALVEASHLQILDEQSSNTSRRKTGSILVHEYRLGEASDSFQERFSSFEPFLNCLSRGIS